MKKVEIGSQEHTKVLIKDEPGVGNVCHEYALESALRWLRKRTDARKERGVEGINVV